MASENSTDERSKDFISRFDLAMSCELNPFEADPWRGDEVKFAPTEFPFIKKVEKKPDGMEGGKTAEEGSEDEVEVIKGADGEDEPEASAAYDSIQRPYYHYQERKHVVAEADRDAVMRSPKEHGGRVARGPSSSGIPFSTLMSDGALNVDHRAFATKEDIENLRRGIDKLGEQMIQGLGMMSAAIPQFIPQFVQAMESTGRAKPRLRRAIHPYATHLRKPHRKASGREPPL